MAKQRIRSSNNGWSIVGEEEDKKSSSNSKWQIVGDVGSIEAAIYNITNSRASAIGDEYSNGKWWDEKKRKEYGTELDSYISDLNTARDYFARHGVNDFDWDEAIKGATALRDAVGDDVYWSGFTSEKDYSSYFAKQKEEQKRREQECKDMLALDTNAFAAELEDSKAALAELQKQRLEIDGQIGMSGNDDALRDQLAEIDKQIAALDVDGKKKYLWEAQNLQKYAGLSGNADWAEMSTKVADKKTQGFGIGFGTNWWGQGDPIYDYINNIENYRTRTIEYADLEGNPYNIYDHMNEDEIASYNYLYNTEGRDSANKYLNYLEYELGERRKGEASYYAKRLANEAPLLADLISVVGTLAGGVGYLDALGQKVGNSITEAITGEYAGPINYNSAAMMPSIMATSIRGQRATNITNKYGVIELDEESHPILSKVFNGKGLADVYQLGMSMVDSAAVAGLTAMGVPGAVGLLGGSAATQGMLDAVERGASDEQALIMGALSGAAETLFEKYEIDGFLDKISKGKMSGILVQMLTEGTGEAATSVANMITDSIIMGANSNWQASINEYLKQNPNMTEEEATKQALLDAIIQTGWDFVGGAVMGGFSTAGGIAVNTAYRGAVNVADRYTAGKQILNANAGVDALKNLASEMSGVATEAGTKADIEKLSNKVTDKKGIANTMNVGKLYQTVKTAVTEQNITDIAKSLERKGFSAEDAKSIAGALAVYANGLQLSEKQAELIQTYAKDERVQKTFRDVVANPKSTTGQTRQKVSNLSREVLANTVGKSTAATGAKNAQGESISTTSKYEVSVDGKTHLRGQDEVIDSYEIADIKDGEVTLKLSTGDVVSADEVSFSSNGEALMVEAFADVGMSADGANAFLKSINADNGLALAKGIKEVFTYGSIGYPMEAMSSLGFSSALTKTQQEHLYTLAQEKAQKATDEAQGAVDKAFNDAVKYLKDHNIDAGRKHGTVSFEKGAMVAQTKADAKQKKRQTEAIEAAKVLAYITGLDFVFYSSGKGSNGRYDPKTGKVHIDLLAGFDANSLCMYTISHELLHFAKQMSPQKYKLFSQMVLDAFTKSDAFQNRGWTLDDLIQNQIAAAKEDGRKLTRDEAYEEVIADACESLLVDGGFEQLLSKIEARDKGLFNELKQFFQNLLRKLKNFFTAYSNVDPNSAEANIIRSMTDEVQNIVDAFTDMLQDASQKNATIRAAQDAGMELVQALGEYGISYDADTQSVFASRHSFATNKMLKIGRKDFDVESVAKMVSKVTGRSIEDARKWVQSEVTIANMVLANPEFLDFIPDNRYEAIKKNSDYPQGTVDLSNLCPKREEFTAMFDLLQKTYPDKLFTADDVAEMRKILKSKGITVACGACFVEDRRQLLGEIADTYIGMWKEAIQSGKTLHKVNAEGKKVALYVTGNIAKQYKSLGVKQGDAIMATDKYVPTQYDLTTYEGFKNLQKNHPTIAMGFERYNNSRGQQAARLIEGRAEYDRQILNWSAAKVKSVNNNGGLRIFSFSDFEVVHLLDLVQVIIDCAAKGVKIQGYTKIPAFARLIRNTGIKINRSLIPLGDLGYHMENGKIVLDYDTTEGIDINDENFLDEHDNPNVGNILIGINPEQIGAAMLDDFVDYIIPFHSNKSYAILKKLGTGAWFNYKNAQHDKDIATGKSSAKMVNIYPDVIAKYKPTNKVEFVNAFIAECKAQGKIPRYEEFLNREYTKDGAYKDEDGRAYNYTYREGYHKLIVDFKMFDKDGNILPQTEIVPDLDEGFMADLLTAEVKKKKSYEFPQEVYDAIEDKFGGDKHSARKPGSYFAEDKYYARQIDKWESLKEGGYITAGSIKADSPINRVGVPSGSLYFDVSKIQAEMTKHDDHLSLDVMKKIPQMLDDPIVITEYKPGEGENTVSVYGKLTTENGTPVVVGIVITKGRGKNVVSKIRTVHARGDFQKQITDDSVLFLGENKKETKAWFQALGIDVPLGGNKFGFIRMLPLNLDSVKEKSSTRKKAITDAVGEAEADNLIAFEGAWLAEVKSVADTGSWHGTNLKKLYANNPSADIIKRYQDKDKTVDKAFRAYLDTITDNKMLDNLLWYPVKCRWGDEAKALTGGTRKYNKAVKDRIQTLYEQTHKKVGTNLGIERREYSVQELKEIFDKHNDNSDLAVLFDKVYSFCNSVNVVAYGTNHLGENTAADAKGHRIRLDISHFNNEYVTDAQKARDIMHEMIHVCSVYAMQTYKVVRSNQRGSWNERLLSQQMYDCCKIFEEVYDSISSDRNFFREYGITNSYEMVAELSNPRFVDKLKQKSYDLWSRVVGAFKRLFGIKSEPTNAYEAVSRALEWMIDNPDVDLRESFYRTALREGLRWSTRKKAPTFYSQMGKVIEGVKQEKLGAASVVSMLRGKGVKAEEIKWSGIEQFLEGKKSVTKAELMEFIAGSMLQVEEQTTSETVKYTPEQSLQLDDLAYDREKLWDSADQYWFGLYGDWMPLELYAYDDATRNIRAKVRQSGQSETDSGKRLLQIADDIDEIDRKVDSIVSEGKKGSVLSRWGEYKLDGGENYREILFKMPSSDYTNSAMRTHWGADAMGILAHARMQDFEVDGKKMLFIEEIQSDWHNEGKKSGYSTKVVFADEKNSTVELINNFYELIVNGERTGVAWNKKYFEARGASVDEMKADLFKMYNNNARMKARDKAPDAPFKDNYHEFVLKRLIRMAAEEGYDSIGWTTADIQSERWSDEFAEGYRIEYDQDIPKFLRKYGKKWGAEVGKTNLDDGPNGDIRELARLDLLVEAMEAYQIDETEQNWETVVDAIAETYERICDVIPKFEYEVPEAEYQDAINDGMDDNANAFVDRLADDINNRFGGNHTVWSMPITDAMKDSVLYEGQAMYSSRKQPANGKAIRKVLSGTFFSGGGTVDFALSAILDSQFAVEYEAKISTVYQQNNDTVFMGKDVLDFDPEEWKGKIDYFHASPVCKTYSKAISKDGKAKRIDTGLDMTTAEATAKALRVIQPNAFTLENVPAYVGSDALKLITDVLDDLGYKWDIAKYNSADYGAATSRDRVFIRAVKDGELPAKPKKVSKRTAWYEVTKDLIPGLKEKDSAPNWLLERLKTIGIDVNNLSQPLYVSTDAPGATGVPHAFADSPAPTITANEHMPMLFMPDGRMLEVSPRMLARISGLPDDYKLPSQKGLSKKIIGNGVPVKMTQAVVGSLLNHVTGQDVMFSSRKQGNASNRYILANALEKAAKNPTEKEWLSTYKANYAEADALEQQLLDINRQIKELTFGTDTKDRSKLAELKNKQKILVNKLKRVDGKLLQIEASKPLADLLEREKARVEKSVKAKAQKSRQEALISRNNTIMRHKIQGVVKDIDKLLNRGNKDKNVKLGLQDTISKALQFADVLFSPEPTHAEVLRSADVDMSTAEEASVNEYLAYVDRRDAINAKLKEIRDGVRNAEEYALAWNDAQPKIEALEAERAQVQKEIDRLSKDIAGVIERARRKVDEASTVSDAINNLAMAYKRLEGTDISYLKGAYDDFVHDHILLLEQEIGKTKIRDMNAEQLRQVYDMFKMLQTAIRDANKLFLNGKKQEKAVLGYNTINEVAASGKAKESRSDLTAGLRKFGWNTLTIDTVVEILNSSTLKAVVDDIKSAQGVYAKDTEDARTFFAKVADEVGYWNWDKDKTYTFTSTDGGEFSIGIEAMMLLYAYSKRKQAVSHLEGKGFSLRGTKKSAKVGSRTINESTTYLMMADKIAEVVGVMEKEYPGAKKYVDTLQGYLSTTMGAKGNEVSEYLYGIDLFVEQYYVPLMTDSQFLDPQDMDKKQGTAGFRRKNSGFTKATVKNATKAITLGNFTEVWSGHVVEMANYHAMVIPLDTMEKLLNFHDGTVSVHGTIEHNWGSEAVQYLRDYINDLNGGIQADKRGGFFEGLIGLQKMSAVALSASVVVQQPTAIFRAMQEIDPKYFLVAPKRNSFEQLKQYSPIAVIKQMGGFDTHTGRGAGSWIVAQEYKGLKGKAKGLLTDKDYRSEAYFWMAGKADEVTWAWIWQAILRETKAKHPSLAVGSKEFMEAAGKRADDVLSRTQVYDSTVSKSGLMRSSNGITKMATSFMGEPTVSINNLVYGFAKGKHIGGVKGTKYFAGVASSVVVAQIAASFAKAFVQAARDDDEDKTYWEKYLDKSTDNLVSEVLLMILNSIPYVRDIVSMLQGWDIERTDMALLGDLIDAIKAWDSDRKTTEEKITQTAGAIGNLFGIPFKNVYRDIKALVNVIEEMLS